MDDKISALTNYTTPLDADLLVVNDTAGSETKKTTWANIKATLVAYLDTLYQAILVSGTNIKTINSNSLLGSGDLVVGTGDVTKVGTPVNNQVGVWTGDGTLEGDADLTFDTSTNTLATTNVTATTFTGALSGTATNATNTGITDDTTTNATMYPTWVTTTTGNLPQKVSSTKMTFNPSTGRIDLSGVNIGGTNVIDSSRNLSNINTYTGGTINGQTISNSASFTGSLTTAGNIILQENTSITLDPAGSADGKYSGITIAGTAGATLAFGDLCYLASADSRWELADADAASTSDRMLGMCVLAAASDGDPTVLLLMGQIRADTAFPTLTIGSAVYVGETAGDIQVAIPTGADNVIRRVGYALTADEIYFNPSMDSQITVA